MTDFTPDFAPNSLPPQNIEAEEIILGGILFDPNAMAKVVDILPVEAFYVQAHRHIYAGAKDLYFKGQPIDLMTVNTWLNDHDLSERSGGTAKLVSLLDRTVSAANIEYYVPLITEKYVRRLLISTGKEISEIGYDTSEDLDHILDLAEQKIFRLTQTRIQQGLMALSDILVGTLTEIQNFQNQLALPGISSGFYDLDAMTGGFQRSDLIIIAARPAMGKTSFALNIAANVAKEQNISVAIFSLEMSKDQLAMRLLSSEGGIPSNRLKNGRVTEQEMEPLMRAMGNLSELPIYIDDTGNLTVMQMRSEVRRLQAEKKGNLGLILLDYLQLMQGSENNNRVQELSRITRSLKGLAREINAPIIALSQLSRAVEQRTNKRPMLSDLRESGCLSGDSLIELADTNTRIPIRELVGKKNFTVFALNEATMKIEKAKVTNAFCTGIKTVFRLKTRLGRTIQATANHQFFTIQGWKRLDELSIKEFIALPRYLPSSEILTMGEKELALSKLPIAYSSSSSLKLADDVQSLLLLAVCAMKNCNLTNRQMQEKTNTKYCGTSLYKNNLSRERTALLGEVVECDVIKSLANSYIYWDEIVSIELAGETDVYDLTVENFHNFIANNIIVHNSIEQDADLVMMLYRDEYYHADSVDQGTAEIIVAKHRNGPTGQIKLLFKPELTQFLNMKRSYD